MSKAAVPKPPEGKKGVVSVPAAEDLSTEHFIRHLELRHPEDLALEFTVRPGETERKMEARISFEALHALQHRRGGEHDHTHKPSVRRS